MDSEYIDPSYFAKAQPSTCGMGSERRPFSNHDARNQVRPSSQIEGITHRIRRVTDEMNETLHSNAARLEDHSDRLFGSMPQVGATAAGRDAAVTGAGQMADLIRSIDALEDLLATGRQRLIEAVDRSTTLA